MEKRHVGYRDFVKEFQPDEIVWDNVVVDGENLQVIRENEPITIKLTVEDSEINNLNLSGQRYPQKSEILDSSFNNSHLNNCNFSNIYFTSVSFRETTLNNVNLSGCRFYNVDIDSYTKLNNCYWIISEDDVISRVGHRKFYSGDVIIISTDFINFIIKNNLGTNINNAIRSFIGRGGKITIKQSDEWVRGGRRSGKSKKAKRSRKTRKTKKSRSLRRK